jgi:hypothetical protein
MYAGGLNLVMGQILRQGPAIRITLISLVVSAERVRMLAQRGEIEVGDPTSPAIPPTRTQFHRRAVLRQRSLAHGQAKGAK